MKILMEGGEYPLPSEDGKHAHHKIQRLIMWCLAYLDYILVAQLKQVCSCFTLLFCFQCNSFIHAMITDFNHHYFSSHTCVFIIIIRTTFFCWPHMHTEAKRIWINNCESCKMTKFLCIKLFIFFQSKQGIACHVGCCSHWWCWLVVLMKFGISIFH